MAYTNMKDAKRTKFLKNVTWHSIQEAVRSYRPEWLKVWRPLMIADFPTFGIPTTIISRVGLSIRSLSCCRTSWYNFTKKWKNVYSRFDFSNNGRNQFQFLTNFIESLLCAFTKTDASFFESKWSFHFCASKDFGMWITIEFQLHQTALLQQSSNKDIIGQVLRGILFRVTRMILHKEITIRSDQH